MVSQSLGWVRGRSSWLRIIELIQSANSATGAKASGYKPDPQPPRIKESMPWIRLLQTKGPPESPYGDIHVRGWTSSHPLPTPQHWEVLPRVQPLSLLLQKVLTKQMPACRRGTSVHTFTRRRHKLVTTVTLSSWSTLGDGLFVPSLPQPMARHGVLSPTPWPWAGSRATCTLVLMVAEPLSYSGGTQGKGRDIEHQEVTGHT